MAVGDKYFAVMKNELAVSNGVATLGPDGLLNASQRPITDSMPTQGSSNPVQSGGVFSALSNKVKISALSGIDLNDVTVDGHYRTNGECTNVPITGGGWEQWTQLLVITGLYSDNTTQIMPIYYTGDVWLRTIKVPGVWTPWRKISIATPPQQFDLPMAEGLIQSSASWYSKDQFGQVHVHGAISAGSGSLGRDTLVATLPEGYRPGAKIEAPATFASGGTSGSGAVAVAADGTIKAFSDISAAQKVVYFDLFFY